MNTDISLHDAAGVLIAMGLKGTINRWATLKTGIH